MPYFGEDLWADRPRGARRREDPALFTPDLTNTGPIAGKTPPAPAFDPTPAASTAPSSERPQPTPPVPNFDPAKVSPSAMPGWEQSKWGDKQDAKYLAGRFLSAYGAPSEQGLYALAEYLRNNGYGVDYNGGDTYKVWGKEIAEPAYIDAIKGMRGSNPEWNYGVNYGMGVEVPTGANLPPGARTSTASPMGGERTAYGPQTAPQTPATAVNTWDYSDPTQAIIAAYQQYLGRTPSAQEIASQLGGGS